MDQTNIEKAMKSIGKRIKGHRNALNQTRREVANIVGISETTLASIEKGENVAFMFIVALAEYFSLPTAHLVDTDIPIMDAEKLKELMTKYHVRNNKPITDLLNKPPELKWTIENLIKSGFFNEGRRVRDVAQKIREGYKAVHSRSAISNTLIKLVGEFKLEREQAGAKNYLYRKNENPPEEPQ